MPVISRERFEIKTTPMDGHDSDPTNAPSGCLFGGAGLFLSCNYSDRVVNQKL
jgi:hypothetical protein